MQCFVFGAANAGKSSLLQGLVRQHGHPGSSTSERKEEEESAGQPPAANIAVNEIPVARGNRQREGPTQPPFPFRPPTPPHTHIWQLAAHAAAAAAISLINFSHDSFIV